MRRTRVMPHGSISEHGVPIGVGLATALFLDKPTVSLDPLARAAGWERLEHLRQETGMTIFLDAFSRRCIGWKLSRQIDARLTLAALEMAIEIRARRMSRPIRSIRGWHIRLRRLPGMDNAVPSDAATRSARRCGSTDSVATRWRTRKEANMILGEQYHHLHFMGIGGSGISSAVQFAAAAGRKVSGCDRSLASSAYLPHLEGIPLWQGHDPAHLEGSDALVIVPAVRVLDPENAELRAAEDRGIPIITWQELLAQLMADRCVLSVAGVHGKGTTTALLALMLIAAGYDPACEIGALAPQLDGNNARIGSGRLFVHEADEFNHNFWHYHPRLAVITSIEFEHPEFFASYEDYLAAFEHFIAGMDLRQRWPLPPTLVLNSGSAGCRTLRERLRDALAVDTVVVACERPADYSAVSIRCSDDGATFTVLKAGQLLGSFTSHLPGMYNVENALCAIAAADRCGVPVAVMREALEGFRGLRRRFEIHETAGEITLIDDYAHHPTSVALTIGAARARFAGRRLIAVYQPHLFTRTKAFLAEYASAFDAADVACITDIFAARERDTGLVHASALADALRARPAFAHRPEAVRYGGGLAETGAWLREIVRAGDVVLLMGAGDIAHLAASLHQSLESRPPEPRATRSVSSAG